MPVTVSVVGAPIAAVVVRRSAGQNMRNLAGGPTRRAGTGGRALGGRSRAFWTATAPRQVRTYWLACPAGGGSAKLFTDPSGRVAYVHETITRAAPTAFTGDTPAGV